MGTKDPIKELAETDQKELSDRIDKLFDPKRIPLDTARKSPQKMMEEAREVIQLTRDHIGFKIVNIEIAKRYEYLQAQLMSVEGMEKVSQIRAEIKGIMSLRELIRNIVLKGRNAAISIRQQELEDEEPKQF